MHNLDAYLVLLLILAAGFYFKQVSPETQAALKAQGMILPLVFFALFVPIRDLSQIGGALPQNNFQVAASELAELNNRIQQAAPEQGDVLFINQRHLLTMHRIEGVKLVPDYEVVFLMEMVMGNNTNYLAQFYKDLKTHRFSLIVANDPNPNIQDTSFAFSEENNAWVERVTLPLLCFYQVDARLPEAGVSILIPRQEPCNEAGDY